MRRPRIAPSAFGEPDFEALYAVGVQNPLNASEACMPPFYIRELLECSTVALLMVNLNKFSTLELNDHPAGCITGRLS